MVKAKRIHIIAGPTASGKSARAVALANEHDGVIINADATQCYTDLRILSARPSHEELASAPHRLYGMWRGGKAGSVGDWLIAASDEIKQCWSHSKLPIICGGTGLYIKALKEGLSPIPACDPNIRLALQARLEVEGLEALFAELQQCDAAYAETIGATNSQRILRALEVFTATQTPFSQWQAKPKEPPFPHAIFEQEIITLPREKLYARCDHRFDLMLKQGAIEEVQALLAKNYSPQHPIMKAVGVVELTAYLQGEITLEEATQKAKQNTRRYAKRQLTWLRNQ